MEPRKVTGPKTRHYNFRARRKDDTAKKKNNRARATAVTISQWAASRLQERRAAFNQTNPRIRKVAPITSRKSWRRARQKRWKRPWRGAATCGVAAEDMRASYRKMRGAICRRVWLESGRSVTRGPADLNGRTVNLLDKATEGHLYPEKCGPRMANVVKGSRPCNSTIT